MTNEELIALYKGGNEEAGEMLVKQNMRLFQFTAKKVAKLGLTSAACSDEDLTIYAAEVFLKNIKNYKENLDAKYTTYLWDGLYGHVLRYAQEHKYSVHIPINQNENIVNFNKLLTRKANDENSDYSIRDAYRHFYDKDPTITEETKMMFYHNIRLNDKIVGKNSETIWEDEIIDFIEDKTSQTPVEYSTNQQLRKYLYMAMKKCLTKKEMQIMIKYYGLDTGIEMTYASIGRELGVTTERVRQIIAKSMRKLKKPTVSKVLKDFIKE